MIASYHNHTVRCHHAIGTEREYIENAIAAGYQTIGFSDHAPMPFAGGYESGFRMNFTEFEDYCQTLSTLKKEYEGKINVLIGLECEYYPKLFDKLLSRLHGTPIEYLILGQHFINNETDGVYSGALTADPNVLTRYVDQVIEGMKTGRFSYVAHPDLLRYPTDDPLFFDEMYRLCLAAKELSIPLEVNFLGIRDHRHYPSVPYLDALAKSRCDVVLGCDAHSAESVFDPKSEAQAMQWLGERGIVPLREIRLRDPFTGKEGEA